MFDTLNGGVGIDLAFLKAIVCHSVLLSGAAKVTVDAMLLDLGCPLWMNDCAHVARIFIVRLRARNIMEHLACGWWRTGMSDRRWINS